ncbi:trimeric intracellular cation channel family protein [Henriciella mobilis]|uniref:Trimeric intracellular cation channel family protein n=2 Tax=Henriciella mobilis TaxID=2305467 RepID=A0A399RJX9_9PROT|nr:trimeric intracellular cation channel family protein [Henriciella mobilis]RIJ18219.1 trimeric intracellular cation channel family protein [Henriciella mobilis]RIJ24974.1 trimeric intracellular cation channel family protein [Henriciella mobilis]RIJ30035.1 trimeric intracellular cation channel family protein [Henriciella mobilis]
MHKPPMSPDLLLSLADRIGVFVFAISGGVLAVRKQMDFLGVIVLAFLPAIGGGTLRDIILDEPVFWLNDTVTLLLAVAGGLAAFFFYRFVSRFRALRWPDAVGMSLFAVSGAAKAMALGHGFLVVLIMGAMTASAGGLIRDVVANEEPLVLKDGELYATCALAGSLVYFGAASLGLGETIAFAAGMTTAFMLRAGAILFGLSLPRAKG